MSIAREYTRSLRKHLRCRAVWPPLLDVRPGDYGVFRGGVFVRVGHLTTDFGVPVVSEPGGRRAEKFQYHSEDALGFGGAADLAVGDAAAELRIGLSRRASFFVSVAELDVERLQSPRRIALGLREREDWPFLRYFVVGELFKGRDLLFYGSEEGEAGVTLRGEPSELLRFQQLGKLGGSIQISSTGDCRLQYRGSPEVTAAIGLNLFRIKRVGVDPLRYRAAVESTPAATLIAAREEEDDDALEHLGDDGDDDDRLDDDTRLA
ncbi:hypothetical protein SAMN02745121_00784 [Nannocystis exedens]|uniref:Uncharacterized protein n=1 Tax=Nannocystis exedens TaxID=54 RepID=A0A1I1TLC7_9BACT|nr:hypothetical protein [Nannocystis exedens]PCC66487.1 hypothetical protein NAEX_09075 [Nannocystis exedens]SFD59309.1 hypothetical protein SAMN02745121_00784 [Nannocystis exedens]